MLLVAWFLLLIVVLSTSATSHSTSRQNHHNAARRNPTDTNQARKRIVTSVIFGVRCSSSLTLFVFWVFIVIVSTEWKKFVLAAAAVMSFLLRLW